MRNIVDLLERGNDLKLRSLEPKVAGWKFRLSSLSLSRQGWQPFLAREQAEVRRCPERVERLRVAAASSSHLLLPQLPQVRTLRPTRIDTPLAVAKANRLACHREPLSLCSPISS
jgi:hypothetical protein